MERAFGMDGATKPPILYFFFFSKWLLEGWGNERTRFGSLMVPALRLCIARQSLFPRLSLSGIDMGESVKESLKLVVIRQNSKGGDAILAGRTLGGVSRGGEYLGNGGALSRQRGCGREGECTGR